jgi:hypothetical protein
MMKKKQLSLIQNKMRIGITLLYGHDSCFIVQWGTSQTNRHTEYTINRE